VEESPVGHKVVGASAMVRSLCELEWGKGERRRRCSLGKEACERRAYKKRKERGGPVQGKVDFTNVDITRKSVGTAWPTRRLSPAHDAGASRKEHSHGYMPHR
jgi:hypothetical protein